MNKREGQEIKRFLGIDRMYFYMAIEILVIAGVLVAGCLHEQPSGNITSPTPPVYPGAKTPVKTPVATVKPVVTSPRNATPPMTNTTTPRITSKVVTPTPKPTKVPPTFTGPINQSGNQTVKK